MRVSTCTRVSGSGCSHLLFRLPPLRCSPGLTPTGLGYAFPHLLISSPRSLDDQPVSLGKSFTLPRLVLPIWRERGGHFGLTYSKEVPRGDIPTVGSSKDRLGVWMCLLSLKIRASCGFEAFGSIITSESCRHAMRQVGWIQPQVKLRFRRCFTV